MPKKTSSVLEKVSSFSIKLAKMRNHIALNLIFFKKKLGKFKKFKFHRHYNYAYIQEYQFSPSNTPLIFPHKKKQYFNNVRRNRNYSFHSMLFMCMCLGKFGVEEREEIYSSMEMLPPIINRVTSCSGVGDGEEEELEMLETGSGEYGLLSVDERAERFIEKFYAQMRMQGQESSNTVSLLLGD